MRDQSLRVRDLLRRLREIHSSVDYVPFDFLHKQKNCIPRFLVWNVQQKGWMWDVEDYVGLPQVHSRHICHGYIVVIYG
jgi:hypothetical protein